MDSFQKMLAKWGFLPIDTNGQPKTDKQPPQKQPDVASKEIAKKLPADVKL